MNKLLKAVLPAIIISILLSCVGCTSRTNTSPSQKQTLTYKIKHSGVLDIEGKRFPLRGMLQFIPVEKKVRLIMLNEMGIKLLVVEVQAVSEHGYEAHPIFISPFIRAVPYFYDETTRCIHEMYLAESHKQDSLFITETGQKRIGNRDFAQHTIIKNPDRHYTLELFLHSGSQTGT